jgi:hypothetical protein
MQYQSWPYFLLSCSLGCQRMVHDDLSYSTQNKTLSVMSDHVLMQFGHQHLTLLLEFQSDFSPLAWFGLPTCLYFSIRDNQADCGPCCHNCKYVCNEGCSWSGVGVSVVAFLGDKSPRDSKMSISN